MRKITARSKDRQPIQNLSVLVPYDRDADYLYLDALGETRSDALSHFTFHMRFDLSLSEIFHLEFAEAVVQLGDGVIHRGSVIPCVVPVREATALIQGVASSESECRRIIAIMKLQPDDFSYIRGGIKLTGKSVL